MLARCFLCDEYSDTDCLIQKFKVYVHKECYETRAYPLTNLEMKMEHEMASFFRNNPNMRPKKKEEQK